MSDAEFFQKVATMRVLQKRYFRTRDENVLKAAKGAEKAIDEEIARRTQPDLF